jgi:hypothetical protein
LLIVLVPVGQQYSAGRQPFLSAGFLAFLDFEEYYDETRAEKRRERKRRKGVTRPNPTVAKTVGQTQTGVARTLEKRK